MQRIVFYIVYPFLWLLSILPFRILYGISDVCYFLIYYVIGYRKKTVRDNLKLALPHLSDQERLRIEKKSYRHLCDMFLEMNKTMTLSQKEMDKRFVFNNLEIYKDLEKQGKSIALMCAHYASYEWVISMNRYINFKGYAIYKKLGNRHFDKLVRDIRSRFQASLISTKETIPVIESNHVNEVLSVYGFASDQSPKVSKVTYWGTFMGIEVPVHVGAELLSKRFDMNVIFLKVRKIKRGYYEASFEILSENPKNEPDFRISDRFMKKVEEQILEAPEYYLWTHKRWKHRKN